MPIQSIISHSTFCAWRLSRSASLKRVEHQQPARKLVLHPNHRHLVLARECQWLHREYPNGEYQTSNHVAKLQTADFTDILNRLEPFGQAARNGPQQRSGT